MKKIQILLERIPLFYFLLPVFLFLHIENQYHHLINYRFVFYEMMQLVIAALLIFFVSLMFFKELRKGSLFAFGFLVAYYFFCDLKDYLHSKIPGFFGSYTFLLPVLFLLSLLLFILIKKSKSRFQQLSFFLNSLLLVLVTWEAVSLLFVPGLNKTDLGDSNKKFSSTYESCKKCNKPDIYYLLFDGYTSSSILKSEFGFDNPLDQFLGLRGFYVTEKSRSNYNLTPFSIGSVFNLDYLPGVKSDQTYLVKDYVPGVASVYQSELMPVLEKEGYKIFNHSIFDFKDFPSTVPPYDLWQINKAYARHNMFWKADQDIGWLIRNKLNVRRRTSSQQAYVNARDQHLLHTIENTMSTIKAAATQPKFVYSHFVLPYEPFSLDSLGNRNAINSALLTPDEYKQGYINQVKYSNLLIRSIVDSILQHKKRPTVIIVQGDHGFRFNQPLKKVLQFENFNAYYFSNEKYFQIKDSVSNVNTFRFVLNAFLDKKLPLLKDTSIFLQYR